jgi:F-type H+-transporting ATPase subunit gamma
MTRRQEMARQLDTLNDLKSIMTAMKNLALVETRKLSKLRANHERVVRTITRAADDFLAHHPGLAPPAAMGQGLLIVVGSERSFCGNFNDLVRAEAERALERHPLPALLAVGSKLAARLEGDPRLVGRVEGPSVAEEVSPALLRLLGALQEQQVRHPGGALEIWAVYHDSDQGQVRMDEITAIRPRAPGEPEFSSPPLLNLEPARFLMELIEHHLFALLTRVFYSSLIAENRFRLAHMEHATRRLENKAEEMTRKWNILRQEEVTQEIALIILSTMAEAREPEA